MIISSLKKNGVYFIPNFFTKAEYSELLSDFKIHSDTQSILNNNNSGLVYYNNQTFISQTLVHSKNTFDFLTHNNVYSIFKAYLGQCLIKASRFYSTFGSGISMWHHDEKNNGYYSKGVICIIYLSDVLTIEDGPFEFISASHHFSQNLKDHDYFEKNLQNKYANKIISVLGRAGTIIFADSRIIHRARPHNKKCCRESLFIQVSKKTKNIYKERILVNPYFLLNQHLKNKELMTYLGFGLRSESHIFPPTSIDTLPLNYETLSIFVKWVLNKTLKKLFEILPVTIKKMVRKNFGKEIDYDSIK